jgi:hypothetical protein
MPIQHAVWTVADTPVEVPQGVLPSEQRLEDMIVAELRSSPSLRGDRPIFGLRSGEPPRPSSARRPGRFMP